MHKQNIYLAFFIVSVVLTACSSDFKNSLNQLVTPTTNFALVSLPTDTPIPPTPNIIDMKKIEGVCRNWSGADKHQISSGKTIEELFPYASKCYSNVERREGISNTTGMVALWSDLVQQGIDPRKRLPEVWMFIDKSADFASLGVEVTPSPIPSPTATELVCSLSLSVPEDGSNIAESGFYSFSWTSQEGAAYYRLEIISPDGVKSVVYIREHNIDWDLSLLPLEGEYHWSVSALNSDGDVKCNTAISKFVKASSNLSLPQKRVIPYYINENGMIFGWKRIPNILVLSTLDDPRIQDVYDAIEFWNNAFMSINTPFRMGQVIISYRNPPISSYSYKGIESESIPGDIIIVLSKAMFVSFTRAIPNVGRVLIAVRPWGILNVNHNLIAHELGHAIGLSHNSDRTKLMCGRPSACRPNDFYSKDYMFFPLTDSEIHFLQTLYPPYWKSR